MEYSITCVLCGEEFKTKWKQSKICEKCRDRKCVICGKPLKRDASPQQRCCSAACSKAFNCLPEQVAKREVSRSKTVLERYGVSNVTYLQSSKEKTKETKTKKREERELIKQEQKRQEKERKLAEKEKRRQEKEEAIRQSKLRPCKECGKLFIPTVGGQKFCREDHFRTCKVCKESYLVKRVDLPYIRNVCYNNKCAAEWRKMRNLEIYGVANSGNIPQFMEKRRQTNLLRYGVDNPFKSEDIKQKIQQTNMSKYGVPFTSQSPEIKARANESMLKRWGEGMPELVRRRAETCLKKYGVSNPRKLPEVEEKIQATNLERYGTPFPQTELITSNINMHKAMVGRISGVNKEFAARLNKIGWNAKFEYNIETKWYDIYEDNYPILIEVDPTYTHYSGTSKVVEGIEPHAPNDHLDKSELAAKYGFQCVHIFDWDDKYKILQMLNKNRTKVYGRKCSIVEIDDETACNFESVYHLQGSVRGQLVSIGLDYNGELIEVMTFGRPRYTSKYQWELLRLCTHSDYAVIGGASKLFKYFCKTYDPESILSYCDRAKFSGEVYTNIGMKLSHKTEPSKIWSKGSKYVTDNLLRQRGYDQLFGTDYGKGTSNEQLMLDNGWLPVYDCGQFVFEWHQN